jgi:hypothetical protein
MARDAAALGPPTLDELARVTVVHAVLLRSATLLEPEALRIAGAIGSAVREAHDADDFIARANAVPHPHVNLVAETVGPFDADGETPTGGALDSTFVAAAFALHAPHELSPVVETPFGWHVLQLLERAAPSPAEVASLRQELTGGVVNLRARQSLDALLRSLRAGTRIEATASADELMARVSSSP